MLELNFAADAFFGPAVSAKVFDSFLGACRYSYELPVFDAELVLSF